MKWIIPILLLGLNTSFAAQCDQFFTDKIYQKIVPGKTCALKSKDKTITEVIYIKENCAKHEGSPLKSCYMVRVCPADPQGSSFDSELIFEEQVQSKSKCIIEGRTELIGSKFEEPRSPVKAEVYCNEKKKVIVKLTDSDSLTKDCELNF